jgi:hypothetical protein
MVGGRLTPDGVATFAWNRWQLSRGIGGRIPWNTQLDTYLVTAEELEQRTGASFPEVPAFLRAEKPKVSWIIPIGCNPG